MKKIFTLISGMLLLSAIPVKADSIKVNIQDYDGKKVAQSFETELTKDADGSYVIADFLGSGYPVKFTFEKIVDDWSDLNISVNVKEDESDVYLLDPNGKYMVCKIYDFYGEKDWLNIYWPMVALDGYSLVYTYDTSDPDRSHDYYASICMIGYLDKNGDEDTDWIYLNFFFDEPTESKVGSVAESGTSPIEYYNISGQKVETPSNGIFIRKQGNNVSKIAIHK